MRAPVSSQGGDSAERGFLLVEILVALTILAASLTVLFFIFGNSLARNEESRSRMAARTLASALLAQAASSPSLSAGDIAGQAKPDLSWRIDVRPYGTDADRKAWPGTAVQIAVIVSWGARAPGQTITLSTLRLLPRRASA